MSWYGFLAGLAIAFYFLYTRMEWLALVFVFVAFVALVYPRTKKEAKKAWADVKKADAFYPEKRFDGYVKGVGKQAAESIMITPGTENSIKNLFHKSHAIAKNFFTELGELFK